MFDLMIRIVRQLNTEKTYKLNENNIMDYVSNGLVLLLDGVKNTRSGHSTSTSVWEDLTENNYDVTMENITINNNNMYFNGNNSIMYSLSNINAVSVEMVIELDKSSNNSQYIAAFGTSYKVLAWSPDVKGFSLGNQKNRYFVEDPYKKSSISVQYSPDFMYLNGIKLENSIVATNWSEVTKYPFMMSGYDTGYKLKGKIYLVRVYNRALTEDEINHNYIVDKARYGIK